MKFRRLFTTTKAALNMWEMPSFRSFQQLANSSLHAIERTMRQVDACGSKERY